MKSVDLVALTCKEAVEWDWAEGGGIVVAAEAIQWVQGLFGEMKKADFDKDYLSLMIPIQFFNNVLLSFVFRRGSPFYSFLS